MEQKTLKLWRFVAPILLFLMFSWPIAQYLPWLSTLGNAKVPWFDGAAYAVALGLIYNMTPLREWANKPFHRQVNRNISRELWEIAKPGIPQDPRWEYKRSRRVFYRILDSDKTLDAKSNNVRFNGFLWTTAADARAISALVAAALIFLWWSHGKAHAVEYWLAGMVAVFLFSFLASRFLTSKHVQLGNEQLEHIALYQAKDLGKLIDDSLAAR